MSLTTCKCILLGQSCEQISGLVDSVAQHCHQDSHLFLPMCWHWCYLHPQAGRKMATVVLGITAKPRYFQKKMEGHFSLMTLFLRSEKFFPEALLQASLHASQGRIALHALLELVIGKRNGITFRPIRSIAGDGVRVP